MKKENIKFYIILGFVVLIGVIIIISSIVTKANGKKTVEEIEKLINSEGNHIVYFMSTNCDYCNLYEYVVDEMKEYNVEFTKVDISKLTQEQVDEIVYLLKIGVLEDSIIDELETIINDSSISDSLKTKYVSYVNQNTLTDLQYEEMQNGLNGHTDDYDSFMETIEEIGNYGTPNLTIVGNGIIKSQLAGYNNTLTLFNYLKENDFIDEDKELLINFVNKEQFDNVLNNDGKHLVVIGNSTCIHCLDYHKALNEFLLENKDETVTFVNLDSLFTTEEEYNNTILEYPFLGDIESTPTTLIIENKEIIDSISGSISKSEIKTFINK